MKLVTVRVMGWCCANEKSRIDRIRFALALVALLVFASAALAQNSYFRTYDQDYGLNVGEIAALAQDDTGFVWIGAHRGLIRFDGHSFVPWAPQLVDEVVYQLLHGPNDELLVRAASGRGWKRTSQGLEPIAGPDGQPLIALNSFDFTSNGRLWAVVGTQVWRRDASVWTHASVPSSETPQRVFAIGEDVLILTDAAAWLLHDDESPRQLLREKDLWFATRDARGAVWIATHFGHGLWRAEGANVQAIDRPDARMLDLKRRGDTIWLSLDRELIAIAADGSRRRLGIGEGIPSGGPLLVDRENSLWLGTFVGLLQFPQPDTWQWSQMHGLPLEHAYAIVAQDDIVFASTWGGLAHLDLRYSNRFVADFAVHGGIVCADAKRGVWSSDGSHLFRWRDDHFEAVMNVRDGEEINSCVQDADGVLWFATSRGLLNLPPDALVPRVVSMHADASVDQLWFDSAGAAQAAIGDEVCSVRWTAERVSTSNCHPTASLARMNAVAVLSPRKTWLVANDGIFEFNGADVHRLRGNHLVEGGIASTLTPTSAGDFWAAGAGVLLRIHPCTDCDDDWRVSETPGHWQGLPGNSAIQARETANGDLWIAGNRGMWRIPKNAREPPAEAPRIVPVRMSIDGEEATLGAPVTLPPTANRLELEFAALSYRDRSLLRYRSRLGDGEWSAATRSPILQFAALAPGVYRAAVAASLDDVHWSAIPATIEFSVLPPWYRTWWASIVFLALAISLVAWLYQLRVRALLRVERERTRIAMDLHDELGSGLGSIGMLAGVAARDNIDLSERNRLMQEIAHVSDLLGSGLRSLVWSLRSGRVGISELGAQMADHARRLFPSDKPRLSVQLPIDPPDTQLSPELRRHMLLLALEAMHNVVRHARAGQVRVALECLDAGRLRLRVEDDGVGFDATQTSLGAGLESMRRRAAAIGATFTVESMPSRGTCVRLDYDPGIGTA